MDLEYMETRQNKVKKIKERILEEIKKERSYYISTFKENVDYNAKMICLLIFLKEYVLENETFSEHFYCNDKLTYLISDNTLNMLLTYNFSIVDKWLANLENNSGIFNLDDFLNDNYFEHHFFSIYEKMSSAHFE
jgi:hypothetical protein